MPAQDIPPQLALYGAAQVRELDRRAIEECGIAGAELMRRAGRAAYRVLCARWPRARRVAIVCGPGNNGGDGYVVARHALQHGVEPVVLTLGNVPRAGSNAAIMRSECETAGIPMRPFASTALDRCDVVVDALLGTGLEREVREEWRATIDSINACGRPVLAIDVPSGLSADTGAILGRAVCAEVTVTFIGSKAGLYTGAGRAFAGEIVFDDLGVPAEVYRGITPMAWRLHETRLTGLLARRPRHAHKGDAGHVLVVGGDCGMPGAARLAGEGAYRAGAGLVTVATHPAHAAVLNVARPELIVHAVRTRAELRALLARADVVALGPGLGQSAWSQEMFATAYECRRPAVVDADGLNLLAADPMAREDWVLTPHPGEAARLLGMTAREVQADRFAAVRAIARRYRAFCVLKGSGTLIATANDEPVALCDRGNPGMASGGMGDVLTGVLAGLLAQGLAARAATHLGVWLHAVCGDRAAEAGEIGTLASDLLPCLRAELNRLAARGR